MSVMMRGASSAFILRVSGFALAYVLQVVLARWMGAAEYGGYTYAISWSYFLSIFGGLGWSIALLRFVPQYSVQGDFARLHGTINLGTLVVLLGGSLIAAVATVIYLLSDGFGFPPTAATALLIGFWVTPLMALVILNTGVFRGFKKIILALAPSELIRYVLLLLLVAAGAALGVRLTSDVVMWMAAGSFGLVILMQGVLMRVKLPRDLWQAKPIYEMGTWLQVSLPLLLVAGFNVVIARTDVLMIGMFLSPEEVGLFNAASRTANLGSFVLLAINTIGAPMIASLYARDDMSGLQRFAGNVAHLAFWPSLLGFAGVWLFAKPILSLFGAEYTVASTQLVILAFGHLINAGCGLVGSMLNVTGYHSQSARVYGYSAVFNIVLNGVLIPRYGITGAAVATMITTILWNVWLHRLVTHHLGVQSSIVSVLVQAFRKK